MGVAIGIECRYNPGSPSLGFGFGLFVGAAACAAEDDKGHWLMSRRRLKGWKWCEVGANTGLVG
jgi:hypothetical protein